LYRREESARDAQQAQDVRFPHLDHVVVVQFRDRIETSSQAGIVHESVYVADRGGESLDRGRVTDVEFVSDPTDLSRQSFDLVVASRPDDHAPSFGRHAACGCCPYPCGRTGYDHDWLAVNVHVTIVPHDTREQGFDTRRST
jgi:hypothetical protein